MPFPGAFLPWLPSDFPVWKPPPFPRQTADAAAKEEGEVQATYYHAEVVPAMDALRAPVDKLEMIVDKEAWPMPSYGDLIFEV